MLRRARSSPLRRFGRGGDVERVADSQGMALDPGTACALPELAGWIANQFRAMTRRNQREGEAEHLGLAAGETELGIDAGDVQ